MDRATKDAQATRDAAREAYIASRERNAYAQTKDSARKCGTQDAAPTRDAAYEAFLARRHSQDSMQRESTVSAGSAPSLAWKG